MQCVCRLLQVPCDIAFFIKPLVALKAAAKLQMQEVFEVTPSRVQIPPYRHAYAVVTFCPPAMQVIYSYAPFTN
jgi:hypothetical protein